VNVLAAISGETIVVERIDHNTCERSDRFFAILWLEPRAVLLAARSGVSHRELLSLLPYFEVVVWQNNAMET
jgi:hypothetical protein